MGKGEKKASSISSGRAREKWRKLKIMATMVTTSGLRRFSSPASPAYLPMVHDNQARISIKPQYASCLSGTSTETQYESSPDAEPEDDDKGKHKVHYRRNSSKRINCMETNSFSSPDVQQSNAGNENREPCCWIDGLKQKVLWWIFAIVNFIVKPLFMPFDQLSPQLLLGRAGGKWRKLLAVVDAIKFFATPRSLGFSRPVLSNGVPMQSISLETNNSIPQDVRQINDGNENCEPCCRSDGLKQKVLEWTFTIVNFSVELLSVAFDQLCSHRKSVFLPVCMGMSILAVLICLSELVYKIRKEKAIWKCEGIFPGFYHPSGDRFGSFADVVGLACACCQCILTAINYSLFRKYHKIPITVSVWPIIFAFGQLCSKMWGEFEQNVHKRESSPTDLTSLV